jgi:protein-S-isoprenylcysteine O-methyltransferase Ste14
MTQGAKDEGQGGDMGQGEIPGERGPGPKTQVVRAAVGFVLYLLLAPGLLFLFGGTLAWPMAWLYFVLALAGALGSRLIVWRRSPDLLRERARFAEAEHAEPWDRLLVLVVAIVGPALTSIVAGIDHRADWGPGVPAVVQVLASLLVAAGFGLGTWAMVENRFFSAVVRIQQDRGHRVVTGGPYRWVRHPAYAGGILAFLAFPLMVDAVWALLPALTVVAAIVVRTAFEDRTLIEKLPGYTDYAGHTRHRLLPGVW